MTVGEATENARNIPAGTGSGTPDSKRTGLADPPEVS